MNKIAEPAASQLDLFGKARADELLGLIDYVEPEKFAGVTKVIGGVFGRMEIAEDEISRAMRRYPDRSARIWSASSILCPPDGMSELAEDVYRSHCRELLLRVARGWDTRVGTDAEVIVVISRALWDAPLTRDAAYLYRSLFLRVMGERATYAAGPDDELSESYEGAAAQIDHAVQNRLFNKNRKLQEELGGKTS